LTDLITIILPVYGRPKLLRHALDSIYAQHDPGWSLLIADDGSDSQTSAIIDQQKYDTRVSVVRRPRNLGLFGNLNASLAEIRTPWQLILCSDDILLPTAISSLKTSILTCEGSRLILSSYCSIDVQGRRRRDINGQFYDCFAPETRTITGLEMLEHLLHYGSVNGNITGLLINNTLFSDVGLWRSDWRQASDWEWLVRACSATTVLVRREPIAEVRVHDGQLSESNRTLHLETLEVLQVLEMLLNHPKLQKCPKRVEWAAYHAQFIFWNILKSLPTLGPTGVVSMLYILNNHVGLLPTIKAFIVLLPRRIKVRFTNNAFLPPI